MRSLPLNGTPHVVKVILIVPPKLLVEILCDNVSSENCPGDQLGAAAPSNVGDVLHEPVANPASPK
jgi:hypothetical protein